MALRDCQLAVVGGGIAGCTAALYGSRYGLDVLVYEGGLPGGQAATAVLIENYPGFPDGVSGFELAQAVHRQAEKVGADFVTAEVMGLSRADNGLWILLSDIGEARAAAVIVATGGRPRQLNVPGEKELTGRGVSYCATCDGFFFKGETIAVIGGGNTAIEEALFLSKVCEKVYVIHRRDALRAESYLANQALACKNIEFVWNSVVVEIIGQSHVERLRIRDVKTQQDRELAVKGVFVAIGYEAHTEWLGDSVEREDGFIVTNEKMQTKSPGLFAAGDCRLTPVRQITTAVGDATVAAYFAYNYTAGIQGRA
ncbi:MAG: thioredoxin-disulfide reductase [Armatimonadota bacterium]